MANRSVPSVLGHCTTVLTILEQHETELIAAGLDVSKFRTALTEKHSRLAHRNDEQEALKRNLVAKTAETQTASTDAYTTASSTIDAIRGVMGKTSPLGKQATALRTALNKTRTRTAKPAGEASQPG
nr:hypothetical protein [Armatimonas sp.]